MGKLGNLQQYVEDIRERFNVPALSIAILFEGKRYSAASGVLNLNTGVEATADSIFQIASISKVFTATLIMQLVDEGKLLLEAPVKQYLRDFNLADSVAAEKITVAQLLNHTNGIPGDFIGNNSYTEQNPLARYVDRCSALYLIHPPGERYSYSNAAYNIAGRLIEVILGTTWFDAIEERIFKPLGMKQAVAHPSQVIKYRVAMGHVPDTDYGKSWSISPECCFPICWAPCGSVLTLSASDLITFAEAHLNDGWTKTGVSWLSSTATKLMQQVQIPLPPYSPICTTHCGLGWHQILTNNTTIIGHMGSGPGQRSMLQLVPEHNVAIAALHNSSNAALLPTVLDDILLELTGIQLQAAKPKTRKEIPIKLKSLTGIYETILSRMEITVVDENLVAVFTPRLDQPEITETHYLEQIDQYTFVHPSEGDELSLSFMDAEKAGCAPHIYYRWRIMRRVYNG